MNFLFPTIVCSASVWSGHGMAQRLGDIKTRNGEDSMAKWNHIRHARSLHLGPDGISRAARASVGAPWHFIFYFVASSTRFPSSLSGFSYHLLHRWQCSATQTQASRHREKRDKNGLCFRIDDETLMFAVCLQQTHASSKRPRALAHTHSDASTWIVELHQLMLECISTKSCVTKSICCCLRAIVPCWFVIVKHHHSKHTIQTQAQQWKWKEKKMNESKPGEEKIFCHFPRLWIEEVSHFAPIRFLYFVLFNFPFQFRHSCHYEWIDEFDGGSGSYIGFGHKYFHFPFDRRNLMSLWSPTINENHHFHVFIRNNNKYCFFPPLFSCSLRDFVYSACNRCASERLFGRLGNWNGLNRFFEFEQFPYRISGERFSSFYLPNKTFVYFDGAASIWWTKYMRCASDINAKIRSQRALIQ